MISRAVDNNNYYILASLNLSAAFNIVNRQLLFTRMETMGIPEDITSLLKDWLSDRKSFTMHKKHLPRKTGIRLAKETVFYNPYLY